MIQYSTQRFEGVYLRIRSCPEVRHQTWTTIYANNASKRIGGLALFAQAKLAKLSIAPAVAA